jgi:membrane protease YdiL (CAAX protease family)
VQAGACSGAPKVISSSTVHWDFALILIFFATAVPWLGRRRVRKLMKAEQTTRSERLTLYASTSLAQWAATGIILWRTAEHGISRSELGLALPNPILVLIVSLLLAGLVFANQIFSLRQLATLPEESQGVLPHLARKVFPQDSTERLAFTGLVLTVAFCEEVVYRGFAQYVFTIWPFGSLAAGVLGSAALFSLAHLYQGRRGLASTFVVGLIFSGIRLWTGSLAAPMVAHFVADLMAGFLAPARLAFGGQESGSL